MAPAAPLPASGKLETGVWMIVLFKAVVGVFWLLVAFGAFHFLNADLEAMAEQAIDAFKLDPDTHLISSALDFITRISPQGLRTFVLIAAGYGTLEVVQAIGLYFRKVWAEWLIIIATLLLIPVELFEIHKHATPTKLVLLALNIVIVVYLWHHHSKHIWDAKPPQDQP